MVFGSSRKFIGERLWMEKYILTQKSFGGENIITHDDDDGGDDDGCEPAAELINVLFETTSPHTGLMIFVVRRAVLTKSPPTSSLIGPLHSVQLPAGVHGCGGGGGGSAGCLPCGYHNQLPASLQMNHKRVPWPA